MSDLAEIPDFLRRTQPKDTPMTNQTPAPKKTKRRDAYCATIKLQIPLTDSASLVVAMKLVEASADTVNWPAGTSVTLDSGVKRV